MLLTVSGPPGGGKSTTASALAERFGFEHISGGDIFRSLARDRGLSLAELNELAESDETFDIELDRRLQSIAADRDEVVLESRLAGWLAGDRADFRFWLDAPLAVRCARIADREDEPVDAVRDDTVQRQESEALRYRQYYDIDIDDRSIYDLVINTARWDPDAVVTIIDGAIERHDPAADEGQHAVPTVELPAI